MNDAVIREALLTEDREDYGDVDTIDAEDKPRPGFAPEELEDAVDVARRGRAIEAQGVPYVLDGIVPAFGMLAFIVAYAKVGKTTFGQAPPRISRWAQRFSSAVRLDAVCWCWLQRIHPSTRPGSPDTSTSNRGE
jgi:hypothetical protein